MKDALVQLLALFKLKPVVFLVIQVILLGVLYVARNAADFGLTWTVPAGYITAAEWITTVIAALLSAKVPDDPAPSDPA